MIVGVGGDFLDVPNFAEARDPETGELQWHFWTTAHKGDPGFKTWPNENAVEHGGGGVWYPSTYDPELNLLYIPTGNANPVMAGQSREGDNLYTASVVALNPDTGKMVWYFQYLAARHARLGCGADAGSVRRSDRWQAAQACWRRRIARGCSSFSTAPMARASSRLLSWKA